MYPRPLFWAKLRKLSLFFFIRKSSFYNHEILQCIARRLHCSSAGLHLYFSHTKIRFSFFARLEHLCNYINFLFYFHFSLQRKKKVLISLCISTDDLGFCLLRIKKSRFSCSWCVLWRTPTPPPPVKNEILSG